MAKRDSSPAALRAECIKGYEWPDSFRMHLDDHRQNLVFDRKKLLRLALDWPTSGFFVLAVVSREYLELGLAWYRCAQWSGMHRFALIAADSDAAEALQAHGIRHVRLGLSPRMAGIKPYRNPGGFDGKGMAIIHSRLEIVKFLVDHGIDVIICDIDALLLRDPNCLLRREADIAFQRVVYFPKPLAKVWGFTACAGFVAYRASRRVSAFLQWILAIQQDVSSDQLAFNLALLEDGVLWRDIMSQTDNDERRKASFASQASTRIPGKTKGLGLTVEALPADLFWRHEFVQLDLNSVVLLHPNSPKSQKEKLEIFRDTLGQDLEAWPR